MARHRVAPRSAPRAVPAGTGASARAHGRHAPSAPTHRALSGRVVARRIALPAASVAVASVVTVGGAVAFASDGAGPGFPAQRPASTAPATQSAANPGSAVASNGVTASTVATTGTSAGTNVAGALAASPTDAAAIAAAIRHSDLTSQVPADAYQIVGAKLSRSDPTWAWARLQPVTDTIDRAQGLLHRTASGWSLVQLGSYEVGCTVAPPQVLTDLDLECPPGAAG